MFGEQTVRPIKPTGLPQHCHHPRGGMGGGGGGGGREGDCWGGGGGELYHNSVNTRMTPALRWAAMRAV